MTQLQIGLAASVPFIFGFMGSLAGGAFSDRLAKLGISPVNSRKFPIAAGLVGMAVFTVPAALTHDANMAVACIALAVFCGAAATANAWALVTATAPSNYVASLGAIQNFGGYFGGSFAPVITGFVVDKTGSFTLPLLIGATIAIASALVYLFVVRTPISAAFLERQAGSTG
jgi:MFS family permease